MLSGVSSARSHRSRVLAALAGLFAVAAGVSGCGSAPGTSPPSGVDQLVIPTPSPDPGDFVGEIDNPWLPLVPGSTWTRESTGSRISSSRVQVLEDTREVAGVETTRVRTTVLGQDGDTVGERVDLYAQDRDGNVWTFGQEGDWLAGSLGAEAGLAMPATPRVGDGFLRARVPGADRARTQVQDAPEAVSVPAGEFTDLVQTLESDPEGAREWQVVYARGVGEVLRAELDGGGRQELVAHRR
jgi:hypothetical protein